MTIDALEHLNRMITVGGEGRCRVGEVQLQYNSNYLISPGWLASIAEDDTIMNATLLYLLYYENE